jgi:hypothetical protein
MHPSALDFLAELEAELREEEDAFYATLGRAIVVWTSVEYCLFRVFLQATNFPEDAGVKFFDNTTFHQKLKMTDDAMSRRFRKDPILPRWMKIRGRLQSQAVQRNRMAHSPVSAELRGKKGKKMRLHVQLYNPTKHPSVTGKPRVSYYQSALERFEEAFRELANDVGTFAYRLEKITGKQHARQLL